MKFPLWPEGCFSGIVEIFILRAFYCSHATNQQNKPEHLTFEAAVSQKVNTATG